jgi:uncharacterized protein (DUF488 family)
LTVWTIGHSTHAFDELVELLRAHSIAQLADVRTVPKSRRHPHFAREALVASLPDAGVAYRHLPGLGGFRKPRADSPNTGWRNDSFRGYADYTQTEEFAAALADLCSWAGGERTAMMCSEGLWWRCHRRLVADRLVTSGWTVCHIGPDGRTAPHELTDFAVEHDGRLVYPAAQLSL